MRQLFVLFLQHTGKNIKKNIKRKKIFSIFFAAYNCQNKVKFPNP